MCTRTRSSIWMTSTSGCTSSRWIGWKRGSVYKGTATIKRFMLSRRHKRVRGRPGWKERNLRSRLLRERKSCKFWRKSIPKSSQRRRIWIWVEKTAFRWQKCFPEIKRQKSITEIRVRHCRTFPVTNHPNRLITPTGTHQKQQKVSKTCFV